MKSIFYAITAAGCLAASNAAAATVLVDFDSGSLGGGVYMEDGFTFTTTRNGGTSLANNCPTGPGGANTSCLHLNNNEIVTVTYSGGAFDLEGFLFNAPGNGGDMLANGQAITETQNGNALSPTNYPTPFENIFSFTFQNGANGSGRVDNIVFGVATVPVPAAGLLMLSGLGALMMRRRRKTS